MFERTHKPLKKVSLTPMIDMVFLLLVFFMVTTTFQKNQATKMHFGSSKTVAAKGDRQMIVVTVRGDDRIGLMKAVYNVHDLRIGLHELLRERGYDQQVVLQSTEDATVQNLIWVMDMLQDAGASNVTVIEDMLGERR